MDYSGYEIMGRFNNLTGIGICMKKEDAKIMIDKELAERGIIIKNIPEDMSDKATLMRYVKRFIRGKGDKLIKIIEANVHFGISTNKYMLSQVVVGLLNYYIRIKNACKRDITLHMMNTPCILNLIKFLKQVRDTFCGSLDLKKLKIYRFDDEPSLETEQKPAPIPVPISKYMAMK